MKGNWRLNENNLASIWRSAPNFKHTSALEIIPATGDGKEAEKIRRSRFFTENFPLLMKNNFSSRRFLRWGVSKVAFFLLLAGLVDPQAWSSHFNDGLLVIHKWPAVSSKSGVIGRSYLLRCHVCCSYSHPLIGFEMDLWLSTSALSFSPPPSDIFRRWYDRMTWVIGRYR